MKHYNDKLQILATYVNLKGRIDCEIDSTESHCETYNVNTHNII